MPELPDVENARRRLADTALNRRIAGVHVMDDRILDGIDRATLIERLNGARLTGTRRHGKYLLADLDDGGSLVMHFGMTGDLLFQEDGSQPPPKSGRILLDFDDGSRLVVINRRLWGKLALTDDADRFVADHALGPDALDEAWDLSAFRAALDGRTTAIKSLLMDQHVVAGIGNVYADEILFQARVHPATPARALSHAAQERVLRQTKTVLSTAIDRGAGADDMVLRVPTSWLLRRRERGGKCPHCGRPLTVKAIGGRKTYFCSRDQPRPDLS